MLGFDCPMTADTTRPTPPPHLHGAAMMIKREVIEKVGMMPEIFFLTTKNWTGAQHDTCRLRTMV